MEAIKRLYARYVHEGLRTIESIPEIVREDVRALVEEMESREASV